MLFGKRIFSKRVFVFVLVVTIVLSFTVFLIPQVYATITPLSNLYFNTTPYFTYDINITSNTGGSFAVGNARDFSVNLSIFGQNGYDYAYKEQFNIRSNYPGGDYPDWLGIHADGDYSGVYNSVYLSGVSSTYQAGFNWFGETYNNGWIYGLNNNVDYSVVHIWAYNSTTHTKYQSLTINGVSITGSYTDNRYGFSGSLVFWVSSGSYVSTYMNNQVYGYRIYSPYSEVTLTPSPSSSPSSSPISSPSSSPISSSSSSLSSGLTNYTNLLCNSIINIFYLIVF
jgi:hypothetical protein